MFNHIICCIVLLRLGTCIEWEFPETFKFGVATSAFQIEGAWNASGKSPSIWDVATHNRSYLIKDGGNGDIACDSYSKIDEDIKMLKNLGVDVYRFSLAWTRILPDPTSTNINPAGVNYYNNLINKLLANCIEPVVTIYHWDLPQKLVDFGGWTNPIIIQHFAHFAKTAFTLFGDRVKTWITINEPRLICQKNKGLIYDETTEFPVGISEYLCTHNLLKAHAEAYHIYDKEFRMEQKGKISFTLDFTWSEPANATNPEDVRAANQHIQFDFGIFANPVLKFDYPQVVIDRAAERSKLENLTESKLPKFTHAEKLRIRGTYDFLGINHYITQYVRATPEPPVSKPHVDLDKSGEVYGDPEWEGCAASWIKVVPWGLRKLLKWIKDTYGNIEIIITENGYADDGNYLHDDRRMNYFKEYINATLESIILDKVNVTGYTAWSLMDNFEWSSGYTLGFGLYQVNFSDPERPRTPKDSVDFYKNIIQTKTVN